MMASAEQELGPMVSNIHDFLLKLAEHRTPKIYSQIFDKIRSSGLYDDVSIPEGDREGKVYDLISELLSREFLNVFFRACGSDAQSTFIVPAGYADYRTTAFWLLRGTPLRSLTITPHTEALCLGMIALDPHSFSRLVSLDCSSTMLDDNCLASLKFLPLVRLDVSSTRITNSGTSHLLAFAGTLRHLLVADNRGIDNESLSTFNDLSKLESIDLSGTKVTIRPAIRNPTPPGGSCLTLPAFVARSKILQPGLVSIVASQDLCVALVSFQPPLFH